MARRQSIHIDGYSHVNPIPAASRVGGLVMSSAISAVDPATGTTPPSLDEQCVLMFDTLRRIVEAAGGTTDDIVKVNLFLEDLESRPVVNRYWLELFPDADSRPARHTTQHTHVAPKLVSCDFTASVAE